MKIFDKFFKRFFSRNSSTNQNQIEETEDDDEENSQKEQTMSETNNNHAGESSSEEETLSRPYVESSSSQVFESEEIAKEIETVKKRNQEIKRLKEDIENNLLKLLGQFEDSNDSNVLEILSECISFLKIIRVSFNGSKNSEL